MKFIKESVLDASVSEVFAFHERPDALELLLPPWEHTRMIQPPRSLEVGTVVILEQRVGPLWLRIEAEHVEYEKDAMFVDVMRRGPFSHWRHEHRFVPHERGCLLRDEIDYAVPLGRFVDRWLIKPRLQRMFDHRHAVTARMLG